MTALFFGVREPGSRFGVGKPGFPTLGSQHGCEPQGASMAGALQIASARHKLLSLLPPPLFQFLRHPLHHLRPVPGSRLPK